MPRRKDDPLVANDPPLRRGQTVADFPRVASEWHPKKNGSLRPERVARGSSNEYWWKCPKGADHEWQARPNTRIGLRAGCPICSGRKVAQSTSLAKLFPALARQWHPKKNDKSPREVSPGTDDEYWWKCSKGSDHEWVASVAWRVERQSECPFCAGRRVSITNAIGLHRLDLAAEWHPTKNGKLTPMDVTAHSSRKVWWRCARDASHVWSAAVLSRAGPRATGCPFCWKRVRRVALAEARRSKQTKKRAKRRTSTD